jgi:hypothetical protein
MIVIPGRRAAASPESILANRGYGFRAPRFARPRNDAYRDAPVCTTAPTASLNADGLTGLRR